MNYSHAFSNAVRMLHGLLNVKVEYGCIPSGDGITPHLREDQGEQVTILHRSLRFTVRRLRRKIFSFQPSAIKQKAKALIKRAPNPEHYNSLTLKRKTNDDRRSTNPSPQVIRFTERRLRRKKGGHLTFNFITFNLQQSYKKLKL